MSFRTRVSLAVLIVVLVMGGVWASAQVRRAPSRPPAVSGSIDANPLELVAPTVIDGSDMGFRIESTKDGIPVGKIVVRIDGVWVDAQVGGSGIIAADAR